MDTGYSIRMGLKGTVPIRLFPISQKFLDDPFFKLLHLDGITLLFLKVTKFLGVIINSQLS